MTCGNCVSKVKSEFLKIGDITESEVQLAGPQGTITMEKHIPIATLQAALKKAGNYTIEEVHNGMNSNDEMEEPKSWINTYKPILLILAYITGVTLIIELLRGSFIPEQWMQNFMTAFFLVFSFFKMLNLKGFAESYSSYDIIAKKWMGWGYLYAFIELGLGIAFLLRCNPLITNILTFVVMSISIIGVLQAVINKRKIKCACLGDVINLPMNTVTIIEDGVMIAMSLVMILTLV